MTIDGLIHACENDNEKHSILNQLLKNTPSKGRIHRAPHMVKHYCIPVCEFH
jgi:hypothetical protein